jgi:hypothetical protein
MALEFDIPIDNGDIFIVMDRIDYWFRQHPYETYGIPQGYDYELGISPYAGTSIDYKYLGNGLIKMSTEIKDFGNHSLTTKDEYINRLHENLTIEAENIVADENYTSCVDHDLVIKGIRSYNVTDKYKSYQYSAVVNCSSNEKLVKYFNNK